MALSRSLHREAPFALVAPLAALLAYLPVTVVPYAFMDDYYLLAWRRGIEGEFWKTATQFGRPLHALFLSGAFSLTPDIASIRLVRLFGLLGAMLLAVLLYYALRKGGFGRWLSTGICVSVVTLGSVQVYVSWAAVYEAPLVAALAGVAWLILRSALGLSIRAGLVRRLAAAAVLLCALVTYQPAAMFFWVFAAIELLRPTEELARAVRKFAEILVVAGTALFFEYAAVRIGVHFYGGALTGRTKLVHDLVGKARWFWNEPIVNGFGMFDVTPAKSVALALAIVAAAGILLLHAHSGWRAFGFLGIAAVLAPLSYLPNLVISEDFASYRSTSALSALLTLYVWLGLWGIARALPATAAARVAGTRVLAVALAALLSFALLALVIVPLARPGRRVSLHTVTSWPELLLFAFLFATLAGLGLWSVGSTTWPQPAAAVGVLAASTFVVAGVVIAARNVTTLIVKPQSVELQLLRSDLDSPPDPHHVVLVKPNWTQGAAPLVRYDEFGPPSTYFGWVPSPATRLVLRERMRSSRPMIDVLAWDQIREARAAGGDVFVDMRQLQRHHVGWSVWTLHAAPRPTAAPSGRRP